MNKNISPIILMADDDDDDRLLVQEAFTEAKLSNELLFVKDGQELLDYLNGKNEIAFNRLVPYPSLILLDLNMPRKDGREALREIKADSRLRSIPIVVLTTSSAEEDVNYCYELGVASFITKPSTFKGLVETMKILSEYWFKIVRLPRSK